MDVSWISSLTISFLQSFKENETLFYPAIITASVAFLAAVGAQVLSHFLAVKRERKSKNIDAYRNLFAPLIIPIFVYFDYQTAFRMDERNEEINIKDLISKVYKHIETNIEYAPPSLISSFQFIFRKKYFEYPRGFDVIDEVNLFLEVLKGLKKIDKKTQLLDKKLRKELNWYIDIYGLWLLLLIDTHDIEKSNNLLSYNFFINKRRLILLSRFIDKFINSTFWVFMKYRSEITFLLLKILFYGEGKDQISRIKRER